MTSKGKLTTNSVEGFHGLALKYWNKRTDLNTNIIFVKQIWLYVTKT